MGKTNRSATGFTIVEVLLGLFVLSVTVIIGFQILTLGNQMSRRAGIMLAANAIAFAKMQEYENKAYFDIPYGVVSNNYEVEDFSNQVISESNGEITEATGKVYVELTSPSLKKVRVDITYDTLYGERLLQYATYVQLGGVGR